MGAAKKMFLPSAKQREAPELRKRSLTCHVKVVDLKTDFDTDGRTLRGRKEVLKARVARDGILKKFAVLNLYTKL